MRKILTCVALALMMSGCSDSREVADELPNSSIAGVRPEDRTEPALDTSIVRAVRIGEDGPNLDACGGYGVVRKLPAKGTLDVRAAPFAQARVIGSLTNGDTLFICARSLDQRWMGVVIVPARPAPAAPDDATNAANALDSEPVDCGVSSPVATKRDYDGPCDSGWVSSSYIRLTAG